MISSVFSPKVVTSFFANFGPIPLISPDERYFSIPTIEVGVFDATSFASN